MAIHLQIAIGLSPSTGIVVKGDLVSNCKQIRIDWVEISIASRMGY